MQQTINYMLLLTAIFSALGAFTSLKRSGRSDAERRALWAFGTISAIMALNRIIILKNLMRTDLLIGYSGLLIAFLILWALWGFERTAD